MFTTVLLQWNSAAEGHWGGGDSLSLRATDFSFSANTAVFRDSELLRKTMVQQKIPLTHFRLRYRCVGVLGLNG